MIGSIGPVYRVLVDPYKNKFGGLEMESPSVTRLVLFTIAVLAGTGLILAERLFLVGLLLVCFSNVIVMNKREREDQKKAWTTPLTKWQIFRVFIISLVMLGVPAYFLATYTHGANSTPEQDTEKLGRDFQLAWIFKTVFLIATPFAIGQPWMRWYRMRDSNEQPDTTA
ncbi:MAG: hypothetical protein NTZ71_18815 [Planctomycetota bacterium]|nr:hypothetical protein [Planctomycetota bacterium]